MTMARSHLVVTSVTRWYHCMTKCVRGADLLAKRPDDREAWIEQLGSYLLLVDYTGRLFREGKATISRELAGIFDRMGSSAESWWARLEKLRQGRLLGRYLASSRERSRQVAIRLGVRRLANLGGCPAR